MKRAVLPAVLVAGVALLTIGAAMIYQPAGFLVLGGALVLGALDWAGS